MLQLSLQARSLIPANGPSPAEFKQPTAQELIEDAKAMEAYIFNGITPPHEGPKIVRVQGGVA